LNRCGGREDIRKQMRKNEAQNTGGRRAVWAQEKEKKKGRSDFHGGSGRGDRGRQAIEPKTNGECKE
jgi:hypothetical protein